ncbi:MAG: hypothetical protein ACOCP2_01615 [Halohasta sp.]
MPESAQPPGDADGPATEEPAAADVDLTELTLKERIALATAQQPAMGLFLVLFSLFAFTFVIALALVYPTVAALFFGVVLLVTLVGGGVFFLLR